MNLREEHDSYKRTMAEVHERGRREAIEECAKVAGSVVIFDGGLLKSKGDMRAIAEMTSKVIATSIRSLLHADGGKDE